jgi:D-alanine-D-alanine ligase
MTENVIDTSIGEVMASRRYGRVAVLTGGRSAEREISLRSGKAVLDALVENGVVAEAIDAAREDLVDVLTGGAYARVFIALHGRGGEDGVMQGLLEVLGIPYTGSGVLGSALAMDKLRTKQVWQGAGIATPAFRVLGNEGDLHEATASLVCPLMVKPAREGSSIGMTKVEMPERLHEAWIHARQYDDLVFAEQWITGVEYTAAILGQRPLPLIRLETPNKFYDYEAKYEADSTRYIIPSGLDAEVESRFQMLAMQAFATVGGTGWGRVDFMVDESGRPWFIEVNTIPGLTDHSLVPMAARGAGLEFGELVCAILDTSMRVPAGTKG